MRSLYSINKSFWRLSMRQSLTKASVTDLFQLSMLETLPQKTFLGYTFRKDLWYIRAVRQKRHFHLYFDLCQLYQCCITTIEYTQTAKRVQ